MKKIIYKNLIFAVTLVVFSSLSSCLKDNIDNTSGTVNSFKEISVPASFDFATTRNITLKLSISDPETTSSYLYVAKVYDTAPSKSGKTLMAGSFDNGNFTYNQVLNLPSYQTEVYLEVYHGNALIYESTVDVSDIIVPITITSGSVTSKNAKIAAANYVLTGYTDISDSNQDLNPSAGAKLWIPEGKTFTKGINFNGNGGTLYIAIEGKANFNYLNINNGKLEVIIGTNGSSNNFQNIQSNYTILNYSGTIQAANIDGIVKNYADGASITGGVNINSNARLENYGTNFVIQGGVNVNSYFLNQGSSVINGGLTINGSAKVDNNCSLIVNGGFMQNSTYNAAEGSYTQIEGQSTFNGSAITNLAKDSYFRTKQIYIDKALAGPQSGYAVVQYINSKGGNSKPYYTNNVHFIDSNEKDENSAVVTFYVAKSACSPGFGEPAVSDKDGDGIADGLDSFPDDSERAFLIQSGSGTILYEDLWPNLGDYDFNDLVINYQHDYITNSKNEITGLIANFQVAAIGAAYNNGFGFSIPVVGDQIKSVRGYNHSDSNIPLNLNGTESGHSNESVIIVYGNLSSIGKMVNVNKGTSQNINPIQIDIAFRGNVTPSQLYSINPFIFVDQDRSKEVHLVGYAPTNLASGSYFGSGEDHSGSTYYTSKKGFPWALNIPTGISHPLEGVDFIKGYPDFIKWVESGGTTNQDWYLTNVNRAALY